MGVAAPPLHHHLQVSTVYYVLEETSDNWQRSPGLGEQLLLRRDDVVVARRQVLHGQFGVLLVGLADGPLVGLELDHVHNFVWGS